MKYLLFIFLGLMGSQYLSAQFSATGGIGIPYEYNKNIVGTGLSKVFVFNTLNNATLTYKSSSPGVQFYIYKASKADKVPVPTSDITMSGSSTYKISNLEDKDSRGYIASDGDQEVAVWVINYAQHQPTLNSIAPVEADDKCESLKLLINKSDELSYYAPNGIKKNVDRLYSISYQTQEWDDANHKFVNKTEKLENLNIGTEENITPPLRSTQFTLKGDQFGDHFGIAKEVSSSEYEAISVKGEITTEQRTRDELNEKERPTEDKLGGSAPITITFYGHGNDNVEFYTWTIYRGADQTNPIARYTDQEFTYEFTEGGNFNYKVVLEVADQTSSCIDTASVSFTVSESWLDIPNYFSPGDSPGSNDEFRVAYKSLVQFKCTIFNRWGVKLYEWSDPAKGWDGKYKGKYVNTGVYFYVIEATGSEGKKYKEAGDINILRSR